MSAQRARQRLIEALDRAHVGQVELDLVDHGVEPLDRPVVELVLVVGEDVEHEAPFVGGEGQGDRRAQA